MSNRTFGKNREFWQSAKLNNYTYMQYYNRITDLAISMFEWKNLPEGIDPRYMELVAFLYGNVPRKGGEK